MAPSTTISSTSSTSAGADSRCDIDFLLEDSGNGDQTYLNPPQPAIVCNVAALPRRKTSFEVDFAKVESAKQILGTATLTDTVDAALAEVINLHARQRLVELLFTPGVSDLGDPTVMANAWR